MAVRLMLGVGDAEPQAWDGKVTIDQGEIVALEGARFRARRCRDRPRLVEGPQHRSAQGHGPGQGPGEGQRHAGLSPAAKKAALAKRAAQQPGGRGDGR